VPGRRWRRAGGGGVRTGLLVAIMTVVVGADGFLGRRLAANLAAAGAVTTVGRQPGADRGADLRSDADLADLCRLVTGQTVYYCANVGGRAAAADDPPAAAAVNTVAPARLAAVADRLVYFSTDYVFSSGTAAQVNSPTCPDSVYAQSKADGEQAVLAASPRSQVVRTSGLYDDHATATRPFADLTTVFAEDDRFSQPTHVDDLITAVTGPDSRDAGVWHVVGPDVLSGYEFWQLASLRWGFPVTPAVSGDPRHTVMVPSPGVRVRRPRDVFTLGRRDRRYTHTVVMDCVGVVLSGRRWKEPDPSFWAELERGPEEPFRRLGAERIAAAYAPNPFGWQLLRQRAADVQLILANNGPWASFHRWCDVYGFEQVFDLVINSQRDGVAKPSTAFRDHVRAHAGPHPISLLDDTRHIVDTVRSWGWTGTVFTRVADWPLERYVPLEEPT